MPTLVNIVPPSYIFANGTPAAYQLDATTKRVVIVCQAHKSGTIDRIKLSLTSKSGTPGTLRVGLQGINDGPVNDATWLASGNGYYDITAPANGQTTVTLASSVTVTAGDRLAVVVVPISGTWDASNRISALYRADVVGNTTILVYPKTMYYDGSSWTRGGGLAMVTPLYTDGTFPPGFSVCTTHSSIASSWTSAANPLHKGNKWVAPCNCVLRALWPAFRVDASQLSDFKLNVFQDSNTTPIATRTVDAAKDYLTGTLQPGPIPFGDLALTGGSTYRFTIEPITATAPAACSTMDFAAAADRLAVCGELIYTTAPSGATPWTDTDTKCGPVWPEIYSYTATSGPLFGDRTGGIR